MTSITSYTITCHRPFNYGAVLQAYALNTKLKSLGIEAKVIDYTPHYYYEKDSALKRILRFPDHILGKYVFGKFIKDNIPLSPLKYNNINELEKNPPKADLYFAGSDQIWNCLTYENGKDDTFFLTFAPSSAMKISYAASLAMPEIPSNQVERYKKNLSAFDQISVREKSGVELLNSIGIHGAQSVVDPVYLLTKDEWNVMARQSNFVPVEKYVLVYWLERNTGIHEYAREIANKMGAKVYSINTSIEGYLMKSDRYFWNASPCDFVKLVSNASAVVTDSFHGISFAIINNKPFYLFPRKGKTKSTNSRMLDLLTELSLTDRMVSKENAPPLEVDFSIANKILLEKRGQSISYIKRCVAEKETQNNTKDMET